MYNMYNSVFVCLYHVFCIYIMCNSICVFVHTCVLSHLSHV